jgi:sodium/bile acid cotransporter 7
LQRSMPVIMLDRAGKARHDGPMPPAARTPPSIDRVLSWLAGSAVIAAVVLGWRYARRAQVPPTAVPRTRAEIASAAAQRGFAVPDACLPGVIETLAVLDDHAARLLGDAPGVAS